MSLFKKLFGMIVATLPHLSAGVLIAHILINYYKFQHHLFFYLIGMFFAMLPDFKDFINVFKWFIKKNNIVIDSTHKFNFMHWPLIMVPSTSIIVFIFNPNLALIVSLSLLSHYLIDSVQSGSRGVGIQWLAPFFTKDFFRFFKPYQIKLINISKYVMPLEEWIEIIVLNPKYPEFWISILVFILTLLCISI